MGCNPTVPFGCQPAKNLVGRIERIPPGERGFSACDFMFLGPLCAGKMAASIPGRGGSWFAVSGRRPDALNKPLVSLTIRAWGIHPISPGWN